MANYPHWLITGYLNVFSASSFREDNLLSGFETIPDATESGKYRSCYAAYTNMKIFCESKQDNSKQRKSACHCSPNCLVHLSTYLDVSL